MNALKLAFQNINLKCRRSSSPKYLTKYILHVLNTLPKLLQLKQLCI